jgi:hypothetical protein
MQGYREAAVLLPAQSHPQKKAASQRDNVSGNHQSPSGLLDEEDVERNLRPLGSD